jgi:hypothetical protein
VFVAQHLNVLQILTATSTFAVNWSKQRLVQEETAQKFYLQSHALFWEAEEMAKLV